MESLWKSNNFTADDLKIFECKDDDDQPTSTRIYVKRNGLQVADWLNYGKSEGRSETDWTSWLNTVYPTPPVSEDHFALVISPRPKFGPRDIVDFPQLLSYLSISKSSFKAIVTKLNLHRALVVLLDRGAPTISRIKCKINNAECQVYTFRLDHGIEHQTAMTITYFPKATPPTPPNVQQAQQAYVPSKTNAFILGYDNEDISELVTRLSTCKESIFSPFTLIKGFLEVERKRRFQVVNSKIQQFQNVLLNYGQLPIGEDGGQDNGHRSAQDPKEMIRLYINVCQLKNQLTAWKTQIARFTDHVADFKVPDTEQVDIDPKEYLQGLVDEHESRIGKCDLVLQGASLAFQMETARLSRLDARNAMRDSKQMKSIALLTMFFLPGTFIATLMAVPEFESMKSFSGLPEWSWYLILFLPLTALVLLAYLLWTNYYESKDQKELKHMV